MLDDLLEEIAELSSNGFLVTSRDALLKLRREANFNWIATSGDDSADQGLRFDEAQLTLNVRGSKTSNTGLFAATSGVIDPAALLKLGQEIGPTASGLDNAFLKLGSIAYVGSGAKARNLNMKNEAFESAGGDMRTHILPGGNAVFRTSGSGQAAIELFAKLSSSIVGSASSEAQLEEEELRPRGGGGSKDLLAPQRATTRALDQKRASQQMAARAVIAAGAQPVVIKIISTVSSKGSAATLMEYLGTRENEQGARENIPVFNQFGNSIDDATGRAALVAEWTQTFKEPYSVSSCVTILLEIKSEVSDEALGKSLSVAFDGKPFLFARDGSTVAVYGVTELVAGRLNGEIKARAGGSASTAYLAKAEGKIASALSATGLSADVVIKGATATENSAKYYLEKFLRTHRAPKSSLDNSFGQQVRIESNAFMIAKQMFAEWQPHLKVVHPRNAFHVVFSGRAGTDAKAMVRAVSDFLGSQIPDHKWVIAHHAETGHVHIHAMIAARDAFGKPLRFTKPELFEWRENFAGVARAHDIAMVATRRADMAATRPFTQNQVGAYERSKFDPSYKIQPSTRLRVEAKRDGRADLVAVKSDRLAIVERWQRTADLLKTASPELEFAYRTVSDFVASVQAFRGGKGAGNEAASATLAAAAAGNALQDRGAQSTGSPIAITPVEVSQIFPGSIQTEIQEFFNMALLAPDARARIDRINWSFDQAARLVPPDRRLEFVAMRRSINITLEARYAELAKAVTPERKQINDAIVLYGRKHVVEGIGAMVDVEAAQKGLELAEREGKDQLEVRVELESALVKAAGLVVEGNAYLREIAKSDADLARAINNAERDIKITGQGRAVERNAMDAVSANPQDQLRLNQINAAREVHTIALKQVAEKQAAEQREKTLQEQKAKIAARGKPKDKDKGR